MLDERFSVVLWPEEGMLVVSLPRASGTEERAFIANARTGAWAEYVGWVTRCPCVHAGRLYSGTADGHIMELNVGGSDNGAAYQAVCVPNFSEFGSPAEKEGLHARLVARTDNPWLFEIFTSADNNIEPPLPDPIPADEGQVWDVSQWDSSTVWKSGEEIKLAISGWQSAPNVGFTLSPGVSITSNGITKPDFEIVGIHFQYQVGEVMG